MSKNDDGIFHKVGHKAHSGVNILIMYELLNKLHEYIPEIVRTLMESLKHAHI